MIEYNQNVEKLETLRAKLTKNIQDLSQSKEDLSEELAKAVQSHNQAVDLHVKINDGTRTGNSL